MGKAKDAEYLVRGAQLKCRCGSAPRKLNLPLCHGVYVTNQPMMNADDNKANINVMFFGICEKTGEKCEPEICTPWLKPNTKTMVSGSPAITTDSFLVCSKGGLIEPMNSGQASVEETDIAAIGAAVGMAAVPGMPAAAAAGIAMAAKNMSKEKTENNKDATNKGPGKTPTSPSEAMISFLMLYEEFSAMPYRGQDSQNRTVGYGHVITAADGIKYDNGITKEEALILLKKDIKEKAADYLDPFLNSNSIILNQQQYDALLIFTFNTGPSWLTKYDDLRNILLRGNVTYDAMYNEFMTWTTAGGGRSLGLYRRRMDELNIFFNGDYSRNYPDWPFGGLK